MSRPGRVIFASALSLTLFALTHVLFSSQHAAKGGDTVLPPSETRVERQTTVTVLVDDYAPQPKQGEQRLPCNRLGGDRGEIGPPQNVSWGKGGVTATITADTKMGVGVWTSLNHPIRDCTPINFSAVFPSQILTQGRIGTLTNDLQIYISDGLGTFEVELQRGEQPSCTPPQAVKWSQSVPLTGGPRVLSFDLPSTLTEITNLNWVVTGSIGSSVVVSRVEFIATVPHLDAPERAFLWSYAMLLANWDPESGLTRDHACFAANQFDNVSASGLQAAAAVMAWRLGFISKFSATEIVSKTTRALLGLPRDEVCCCSCLKRGSRLWPHFVDHGQIVTGTEWSSIDTVIAAVALLEAQEALGLNATGVERTLRDINWEELILPDGHISHGYWSDCQSIEKCKEGGWRDFGTESWIVNLGYAAATGHVAEFDHTPPTYNGSGFIDELAWLLMPPCCRDRWGTEWCKYSQWAVDCQLKYYQCRGDPDFQGAYYRRQREVAASCRYCRDHPYYGPWGLFGLTADEIPDLSVLAPEEKRTYLAFGVGGEISPTDGTELLGHAVIVPHYAGVIASLRPTEAIGLWNWIETKGLFTPLNEVASLMFTDEVTSTDGFTCTPIVWNARKGSWELGLQTLGWGRYLVGDDHPLYQGVRANDMLRRGYVVICPACRIFLPIVMKQYG